MFPLFRCSVPLLMLLSGCFPRGRAQGPRPAAFTEEVRRVLRNDQPSPRFYRDRARLGRMGNELDAVLISLAQDQDADLAVRRNAITLLAERADPVALPVLRRILLQDADERLRTVAVAALHSPGFVGTGARNAIRAAIGDPSRQVRLAVLQLLDSEDVDVMRSLLAWETDPEVSTIARQLVMLAESRGAPLTPNRVGDYQTTVMPGEPRLVFRHRQSDSVARTATGALLLELPGAKFVPLADTVEVVRDVLPAFLAPDRGSVVWESGREIHVLDLKTGEARSLGAGIAPRLLPFTERIIWVREQRGKRRSVDGGTEIAYEVWSATVAGGEPARLGELRATARPDQHGNASPVRWMIVAEVPEGFALRGPGIPAFVLPNPFAGSSQGRSGLPRPVKPSGEDL